MATPVTFYLVRVGNLYYCGGPAKLTHDRARARKRYTPAQAQAVAAGYPDAQVLPIY